MLGWIPIIGPIIEGVVSIFVKKKDVELEKYKTNAATAIEITKLNNELTIAFKDQIGVRIARDLIILPTAIWTALVTWDTIWAENTPGLMWHVASFEGTAIPYLPYAVLTFLLGQAWINKVKQ